MRGYKAALIGDTCGADTASRALLDIRDGGTDHRLLLMHCIGRDLFNAHVVVMLIWSRNMIVKRIS